jgi:hypothetical protein
MLDRPGEGLGDGVLRHVTASSGEPVDRSPQGRGGLAIEVLEVCLGARLGMGRTTYFAGLTSIPRLGEGCFRTLPRQTEE